jgi:hypothetical protein
LAVFVAGSFGGIDVEEGVRDGEGGESAVFVLRERTRRETPVEKVDSVDDIDHEMAVHK